MKHIPPPYLFWSREHLENASTSAVLRERSRTGLRQLLKIPAGHKFTSPDVMQYGQMAAYLCRCPLCDADEGGGLGAGARPTSFVAHKCACSRGFPNMVGQTLYT